MSARETGKKIAPSLHGVNPSRTTIANQPKKGSDHDEWYKKKEKSSA